MIKSRTPDGMGVVCFQFVAIAYVFPADRADAPRACTTKYGWSTRRAIKRCPTVPVAPSTPTLTTFPSGTGYIACDEWPRRPSPSSFAVCDRVNISVLLSLPLTHLKPFLFAVQYVCPHSGRPATAVICTARLLQQQFYIQRQIHLLVLHGRSRWHTRPRELARFHPLPPYNALHLRYTPLFQPQDEPQKVFPEWPPRGRESRTREYFLVHPRVDLILRLVFRLTWSWIWKAERRLLPMLLGIVHGVLSSICPYVLSHIRSVPVFD